MDDIKKVPIDIQEGAELHIIPIFRPDGLAKKVYIRFIGTHSEYDKIMDIQNI